MKLDQWQQPKDYFGFNPVGDYGIYARTRDSSILDNCNWEEIWKHLKKVEAQYPPPPEGSIEKYKTVFSDGDATPKTWVYEWEASHWACGWLGYMMIREDAPIELLKVVELVKEDLDNYCVYNEERYCEMKWEANSALWKNMDVKERIYYCQRADISIFAARRDDLPDEVEDYLDD